MVKDMQRSQQSAVCAPESSQSCLKWLRSTSNWPEETEEIEMHGIKKYSHSKHSDTNTPLSVKYLVKST